MADLAVKPTATKDDPGHWRSLEDQFAFYGSYHTNIVNVAIHVICVPMIFFTSLVLVQPLLPGSFYTVSLPIPSDLLLALGTKLDLRTQTLWQLSKVELTPSFLTAAGYATYFILLEPVAGALYAPFLLTLGHLSNVVYQLDPSVSMKYAGIVWTASWIAQFIGHGNFEGRAPALFDSLLQALVLALFFVFLEVLFALGYRPALHKRVQNRIGKRVLEYRQQKKRKEL